MQCPQQPWCVGELGQENYLAPHTCAGSTAQWHWQKSKSDVHLTLSCRGREFFEFFSWAKPCLALPGSEHMEVPLIYHGVLHPPETVGQDSPAAAGLRFWVQNYAFHSSQFEEKSRGAMAMAAFHCSQILTSSNFPGMPREEHTHTTSTGSPHPPSDQAPVDQEEPRAEGIPSPLDNQHSLALLHLTTAPGRSRLLLLSLVTWGGV